MVGAGQAGNTFAMQNGRISRLSRPKTLQMGEMARRKRYLLRLR
jgi:hypothetical protein